MKKNITSLLLFISLTAHASDIIGGIDIPNLSTPECMEIKYSPAPIYSAPEGKKVGILVLDNPQLALTDKLSCDIRPVIQSKINNINKNLDVIEISYSHLVPAVYQIVKNTHTWFKIKNGDNYLWLKKESHWKYVSYEQDLVQGIQTVEEFCNKTSCANIPLSTKNLIKNNERGSCYSNVYAVNGKIITIASGRKVYPAKMLEELVPLYAKKLPINTYIPVYSKNKKWNGFYYSRGC